MWLFGSRSSSSDSSDALPNSINETTHAERQRNKQIIWLREEINNLIELERDRRYTTSFTVQESTTVTLDIKLTDRFPFEAPKVTASPSFTHPWVDNQMTVIGCPLLQQFTPHSNLGIVIKSIIEEFKSNPPNFTVTMATFPTPPPIPPPYRGAGPGVFNPPPPPPSSFSPYSFSSFPTVISPQETTPLSPPLSSPLSSPPLSHTVPDRLPGISDKSNEMLEKYLNDEECIVHIDKFISQQDIIKKIQSEMEVLFQSNEELAKQNLDKEPLLQSEWAKLQDKLIELQSLRERYDTLHSKQSQLIGRYDKRQVSASLKSLTQETETATDLLAEDFLDQKTDSSTFLQKYIQERKLYHLRNAKLEMLKYQRL